MKIDFCLLEFQPEQLRSISMPARNSATCSVRVPSGSRATELSQLNNSRAKVEVWNPAYSERSALHHHVQELAARIKALQKSKPDSVAAV